MATLDSIVRALYDAGIAAHRDVTLSFAAFTARLAGRAVTAAAKADDLVLAVACEEKDPIALAKFESDTIARLRTHLRKLESDATLVDELIQTVRVRVLVGDDARIATYTGAGSLLGWLRVMAVRLHANAHRDRKRAAVVADPDELDEHAATLIAPERAILDGKYGAAVRGALSAGLRALPQRDRALLRFHYIEGVSVERIGAMYGVNKSTISRWLAAARDQLVTSTLAQLGVDGTKTELLSLCRQVLSRLDLTLSALHVEALDAVP